MPSNCECIWDFLYTHENLTLFVCFSAFQDRARKNLLMCVCVCVLERSNTSKGIRCHSLSKICLSELVGGFSTVDTAGGGEIQSRECAVRQVGTSKYEADRHTRTFTQEGHCEVCGPVKAPSLLPSAAAWSWSS